MSSNATLEQIASFIRDNDNFAIAGHVDPDPDCLGSMGALYLALSAMGKRAVIIPAGSLPESLMFIPGVQSGVKRLEETDPESYDCAIVVDCDPERTGDAARVVSKLRTIVNLDHHSTNKAQGHLNHLDTKAAATGEIVYRLLQALGTDWTKDIATAIYAALSGDTGSFRYSNTTSTTFDIASDLVAKGVEPHYVAQQIYERRPLSYVRLIAASLDTLRVSDDGLIASMLLRRQMLTDNELTPSDAEGLVTYPRMIDGVEVALMFREEGEATKVSFRSQTVINVAEIARSFGGGGHPRASGCTIGAPIAEVVPRVIAAVEERVQNAKKEGLLQ